MAEQKTNAMRILDRAGVAWQMHTYGHEDGRIDGLSVAEKLGQPVEQVFKTLVTQGASQSYYVFVIPVAAELDLKKAARAAGEKSVSMLHVSEINRVTGYIRGGCSPVGMKKQFPTFFDRSVENLPAVVVSGGRIGCQIEAAPGDLLALVGAKTADLLAGDEPDRGSVSARPFWDY